MYVCSCDGTGVSLSGRLALDISMHDQIVLPLLTYWALKQSLFIGFKRTCTCYYYIVFSVPISRYVPRSFPVDLSFGVYSGVLGSGDNRQI